MTFALSASSVTHPGEKVSSFPRRGSDENGMGTVIEVNGADVVDARWGGGRHW